jgi:putative acetyltransferase
MVTMPIVQLFFFLRTEQVAGRPLWRPRGGAKSRSMCAAEGARTLSHRISPPMRAAPRDAPPAPAPAPRLAVPPRRAAPPRRFAPPPPGAMPPAGAGSPRAAGPAPAAEPSEPAASAQTAHARAPAPPPPPPRGLAVRAAAGAADVARFRALTRRYYAGLGEDLGFQGIAAELAALPGAYAPARGGAILLAFAPAGAGAGEEESGGEELVGLDAAGLDDAAALGAADAGGACVGGVALRALAGHAAPGAAAVAGAPLARVAEMKRLFVAPGARRRGAGAALVAAALAAARELGYAAVALDTLERLEAANAVYAAAGFAPAADYNGCPLPGTLWWARRLD